MKLFKFVIMSLMLFGWTGLAQAAEATPAGEITYIKGRATVTQDGKTLGLYTGASVIVGDRLRTGKGARLRLRMIDGAEVWLGEHTDFTVREYSLRGDGGTGSLELAKGFFRAVTGRITKLADARFEVKTPLAVIGVRGTDFWGEQHADRLRVAMLGGTAITVSNEHGSVEITEAGFLTEVTRANPTPSAPVQLSEEAIKKAAGTVM